MRTLIIWGVVWGSMAMMPASAMAQHPRGPQDCRSTELWDPTTRRCTVRNNYTRPYTYNRAPRRAPAIVRKPPPVVRTPPAARVPRPTVRPTPEILVPRTGAPRLHAR